MVDRRPQYGDVYHGTFLAFQKIRNNKKNNLEKSKTVKG